MSDPNIFSSVRKATGSHYERIHTQFLADALHTSICSPGQRSLFDEVWQLCAPEEWKQNPPRKACVTSEHRLELNNRGGKRIDIAIVDDETKRVLGIEAKTSDRSVEKGQLNRYFKLLCEQHTSSSCAIAYLTPFNHDLDSPTGLETPYSVEEFRDFCCSDPKAANRAQHVSWLDITRIDWHFSPIWLQHRTYVESEISNVEKELNRRSRNRTLDSFFSDLALDKFWSAISAISQDNGDDRASSKTEVEIELARIERSENGLSNLTDAFEILIGDSDLVAYHRKVSGKEFSKEQKSKLCRGRYGAVHNVIFQLADSHDHVKVTGIVN